MTHPTYEGYSASGAVLDAARQRQAAEAVERQMMQACRPPHDNSGFVTPKPYVLTGPVPDKRKPDVWAVYRAAQAAKFDVLFEPGLALRLGRFGLYVDWYVFFGHKYHQRFIMASAALMCTYELDEFTQWLRDHPA